MRLRPFVRPTIRPRPQPKREAQTEIPHDVDGEFTVSVRGSPVFRQVLIYLGMGVGVFTLVLLFDFAGLLALGGVGLYFLLKGLRGGWWGA